MATRSERVQLGIFLTVSASLFAGVLVLFAGVRLMRGEDTYRIEFEDSVSGLNLGSQVRYKGVRVGSVSGLELSDDGALVIVTITVRDGLPVVEGMQAVLASAGVTGASFISLEGGEPGAARIKDGGKIPAGQGFMQRLSERADKISARADVASERLTSDENLKRIEATLARTEGLIQHVDELVVELTGTVRAGRAFVEQNRGDLEDAIRRSGRVAGELEGLARETRLAVASARRTWEQADLPGLVRSVDKTVLTFEGKLAQVPLGALAVALERALVALEVVMVRVGQALGQNQDQLRAALLNLRLASDELKELSRSLREEPSRLLFSDPPAEREGLR
jgi:phospholipid/cholesterol/gamma-HCH transport system substrate-binding protein